LRKDGGSPVIEVVSAFDSMVPAALGRSLVAAAS